MDGILTKEKTFEFTKEVTMILNNMVKYAKLFNVTGIGMLDLYDFSRLPPNLRADF